MRGNGKASVDSRWIRPLSTRSDMAGGSDDGARREKTEMYFYLLSGSDRSQTRRLSEEESSHRRERASSCQSIHHLETMSSHFGSSRPAGSAPTLSDLVSQSRKLTHTIDRDRNGVGADLPSINLPLDQLESQSRSLAAGASGSQALAADSKA